MKQPRISSNAALIDIGGLVSNGLFELGELLDLQTVDHDGFNTQLTDYILQHGLHQEGKQELANRSAAFKTAKKNCRNLMRVTRDVMKPTFGYEYSLGWNTLGFVGGLGVPNSLDKLLTMAHLVRNYLTAHPTKEVAPMNVTAANATLILNALATTRQAVANYQTTFKTMGNNRDAKAKVLRGKIRLLTAELANVLPPVDPRWGTFGLSQPGLKQSPAIPQKLSAVVNGNDVALKWDAAARAELYRLWIKVSGVHTELTMIGSRTELDFTIENLPSGAVVDIAVSASNNGGESQLSEVVTVTIP